MGADFIFFRNNVTPIGKGLACRVYGCRDSEIDGVLRTDIRKETLFAGLYGD